MSHHEGVSCDACMTFNFSGRRYKCLICFDYDLCSSCYEGGASTTRHTTDHPMQCIVTRNDFDIFYGGEALSGDLPQSFTCPYCGKMGYTELTLQEHITADHSDTVYDVVCPICASAPSGEAINPTDDFAAHLQLDHRSCAPRDLDEPSSSRHGMRRVPMQSRTLGRGMGRRNMSFGSVGSGFFSPSSRDSMDPIAELLSQLSGVRRSMPAARQPLERLPRRSGVNATAPSSTVAVPGNNSATGSSAGVSTGSVLVGSVQNGLVVQGGSSSSKSGHLASAAQSSGASQSARGSAPPTSQFLLAGLGDVGGNEMVPETVDRSSFMQEIVMSALSDINLSTDSSVLCLVNTQYISDLPCKHKKEQDSDLGSQAVTDASTQTQPAAAPVYPVLHSSSLGMLSGSPSVTHHGKNVPSANLGMTSFKFNRKAPLISRSSTGTNPPPVFSSGAQSNGNNRPFPSFGSVSFSLEASSRGRNVTGSVSPVSARRKLPRGVLENRATEPPPPH